MNALSETPTWPAPKSHRSPARTIRTFLAEDSPLLMALLARIVSMERRVLIVGSAADGGRAFRDASTLAPDLVITDLHMLGMDGAELTRRLKELPNPPVVFVATADDTREARDRCMAAGANVFLVKDGSLVPRLPSTIQEFFPNHLPEDEEPETVCDELFPQYNHAASDGDGATDLLRRSGEMPRTCTQYKRQMQTTH